MLFIYHPSSGQPQLQVAGELYTYLFRVRRHKVGEILPFRNLTDGYLYLYRIEKVDKREALLRLVERRYEERVPPRSFHLLWCIIDPKRIEKSLPALNEIGVSKISFISCQRSQKNFRLRLDKLHKILINSCQQCGRTHLMELELLDGVDEVLKRYPDTVLLDFCPERVGCGGFVERVLVGPEGGMSPEERSRFQRCFALDTPLVLRSETAALSVSARMVLF
ncbi:MAG: 16S rRNA (uracil(1498)-N(3))-methyltransferase [Nitratiruptor sp.]|nr:16S rRNA (uracil(1498)-N(3))-methyltransferase [Nitratiruptor sp.]NPA83021.1 16S rRNA (uracil(1498)-N(3))-methyltransferase [Campylobacterota bacterium]